MGGKKTRSQIGKSSKNKGATFERAIANKLKLLGYNTRRGVQYCGGPDSPDLVWPETPFHPELKAVESLNIHKAYEQAKQDASEEQIPIVIFKKNNKGIKVCMDIDDWLQLVLKVYPPNDLDLV